MTFEEFKKEFVTEILWSKAPMIRPGQALMNFLGDIWVEEYKRISAIDYYDEKNIDCFFNDELMENTMKHLEKVWINYPN